MRARSDFLELCSQLRFVGRHAKQQIFASIYRIRKSDHVAFKIRNEIAKIICGTTACITNSSGCHFDSEQPMMTVKSDPQITPGQLGVIAEAIPNFRQLEQLCAVVLGRSPLRYSRAMVHSRHAVTDWGRSFICTTRYINLTRPEVLLTIYAGTILDQACTIYFYFWQR